MGLKIYNIKANCKNINQVGLLYFKSSVTFLHFYPVNNINWLLLNSFFYRLLKPKLSKMAVKNKRISYFRLTFPLS